MASVSQVRRSKGVWDHGRWIDHRSEQLWRQGNAEAADFDWHGFDEGDEVNGDGFVELQPDGSLEGEFAYDNGDESTLKARPW